MAPLTQNGVKELPSTGRTETIRLFNYAHTTVSHHWGRHFTHSLTSVYVKKILYVVGCVSKYV